MAMRSAIPSTTHNSFSSRRSSRHRPHSSASVRLKQRPHRWTFCFTSEMAAARSRAYSSGARRMWKARRCAVFSPMPGSLASCATSRFNASGLMRAVERLERSGDARDLHAAGDLRELLLGVLVRLGERGVHGGGDEVLEHGEIVRIDQRLVDLDRLDRRRAGGDDGHAAVPGLPLDGLVGERLLARLDLLGELVGLPDEVVQIHAWHRDSPGSLRRAPYQGYEPSSFVSGSGGGRSFSSTWTCSISPPSARSTERTAAWALTFASVLRSYASRDCCSCSARLSPARAATSGASSRTRRMGLPKCSDSA